MGILSHLFYPWGLLLQAAAILHFIRRRPDTYWLYIILFLGPVGALVYIFAEIVPDAGLLNQSFKGISRGKRIRTLELAIRDNPSAGNFEELGELLMEDGKLQPARETFDKAIAARSTTLDTFYHRGVCAAMLAMRRRRCLILRKSVTKDPESRFLSGRRSARARLRADRPAGKGRGALPQGDGDVDAVRDVFEFCGLSCGARPGRRGARVGAKGDRQRAYDAVVFAAAREAVVAAGAQDFEAASGVNLPPGVHLEAKMRRLRRPNHRIFCGN